MNFFRRLFGNKEFESKPVRPPRDMRELLEPLAQSKSKKESKESDTIESLYLKKTKLTRARVQTFAHQLAIAGRRPPWVAVPSTMTSRVYGRLIAYVSGAQ